MEACRGTRSEQAFMELLTCSVMTLSVVASVMFHWCYVTLKVQAPGRTASRMLVIWNDHVQDNNPTLIVQSYLLLLKSSLIYTTPLQSLPICLLCMYALVTCFHLLNLRDLHKTAKSLNHTMIFPCFDRFGYMSSQLVWDLKQDSFTGCYSPFPRTYYNASRSLADVKLKLP